jgi:hypothetical protein
VTEPVRFQVEDNYYDNVTGEMDKAYLILKQWVQLFPDDFIAHNNFSRCLLMLGKQDQSLAEAREAARLFPSPWSFGNVIQQDILTDRLGEAKAVFSDADARKFDDQDLRDFRFSLAFLQNDPPEMQKQLDWAVGKPGADHALLNDRGIVEADSGHYRNYLRFSNQSMDLAAKEGDRSDAAEYTNRLALEQVEVGNIAQARQLAVKALAMSQNSDTEMSLALALARSGEIARAQSLIDKINQESPLDTVIQNYNLPAIRASIKLQANDPAGAIEALRPAMKYDLAYPRNFGGLYPAYIRGLAYLRLGDGRLASAEFQKLFDHPGMVGMNVIGALSRLQMARAQSLAGDKAAALKSYADFLTLWKDADSDLPIYRQAKAEFARLSDVGGKPN